MQPCCKKYVSGSWPESLHLLTIFSLYLCFMLQVKDVNSTLAAMSDTCFHANFIVILYPSGTKGQIKSFCRFYHSNRKGTTIHPWSFTPGFIISCNCRKLWDPKWLPYYLNIGLLSMWVCSVNKIKRDIIMLEHCWHCQIFFQNK